MEELMSNDYVRSLLGTALKRVESANEIAEANSKKFTENIEQIGAIVDRLKVAFGDGLDFVDLQVIGEVVSPIMNLANQFEEFSGAEKKGFVQEVIWVVYNALDKGKDGSSNNINLPWLFGSLEAKVEKAIIFLASGTAVEAVYTKQ
jgi:hypothetical protein